VFPPRDEAARQTLGATIEALAPLSPGFISVTCGAAGSASDGTRQTVRAIKAQTGLPVAAHMTCMTASRQEIEETAKAYWAEGVRHIVALRGDRPKDHAPAQGHYRYASELVGALKRVADFEISVAAYPEKHPEALSLDADIDNLARKVDAGADRAITQYFLDPGLYFRFLEKVRARGITVPVVAGVMPVTNFRQIANFSRMCGASVPSWLERLFSGLDDDPEARRTIGTVVLAEQMRQLLSGGVTEFHVYTLNRATLPAMLGRLFDFSATGEAGLRRAS
jgi:methylenetetrahydrofolate reductase (NADPH)